MNKYYDNDPNTTITTDSLLTSYADMPVIIEALKRPFIDQTSGITYSGIDIDEYEIEELIAMYEDPNCRLYEVPKDTFKTILSIKKYRNSIDAIFNKQSH